MKIGFVTAILPGLSLEEVLGFASSEGFDCLEVMCWPRDATDKRRYAGVTHLSVEDFGAEDAERVKELTKRHGVAISSLGYYPNPLTPNEAEREVYIEHIKRVIAASSRLGVNTMTTFIGRDPAKSVEDNWPLFEKVWPPVIKYAEEQGVKIGIENCPMLFSLDEWPGGKNLAATPEIWRRMFETIPSPNFGLNFDPSHLVWQGIDYVRAMHDFAERFVHVHVKDEKIDPELLYARGTMGFGWHMPKIPGLGTVDWARYFKTLEEIGYDGPACIEVEDRAFEDSLEGRKQAIRESKRHLDLAMTRG
jgi:sugar phosphate isomerase/epimerase